MNAASPEYDAPKTVPGENYVPSRDPLSTHWMTRGNCKGEDPELFFAPNGQETKEEKKTREDIAIGLCAQCMVRTECLNWAIFTKQEYGIWGGMNELDRRTLRRGRARQAADAERRRKYAALRQQPTD